MSTALRVTGHAIRLGIVAGVALGVLTFAWFYVANRADLPTSGRDLFKSALIVAVGITFSAAAVVLSLKRTANWKRDAASFGAMATAVSIATEAVLMYAADLQVGANSGLLHHSAAVQIVAGIAGIALLVLVGAIGAMVLVAVARLLLVKDRV